MNLSFCKITLMVLGTLNSSLLLAQALPAPAPASAVEEATLPAVTVSASADASAAGLTKEYAGGQVARGGKVGILGNVDIMDTPFNTTSYTQQFIQDRQAQSVADVLQADPSVRIGRGFGNYQETYVIRGFPVYSDDIAYNGLYGILPRQYISTEMLERVELIHGTSAFLNGAAPGGSALGGSISLLPKRAGNAPLNQVSVGTQTGSQTYLAADIARRFGPEDRVGIRLNAAHREGGTGIDNEKRDVSLFSLGLDYRGNNFRLSADIGSQDSKLRNARPSVNIGSATVVPSAPGASTNYGQAWDYSSERDVFGTFRAEVDVADNVTAWAAFGARKTQEYNVLSSDVTLSAANNGSGTSTRFDNGRQDSVHTGEVGIRSTLYTGSVKHTLIASASMYELNSRNGYVGYSTASNNIYSPVVIPQSALPLAYFGNSLDNPQTTNRTNLSSIALADTLGFFDDRLSITLGGRQQSIKQINTTYLGTFGTGAPDVGYNANTITPVAGVVFKLTPSISVYGNYIEGLQPAVNAPPTAANFGQTFAPYKSKQKEIGAKYDAGKLGLTAALFSTTQPSAVTSASNIYSIDGEQRNQGLELSAFGEPFRGLRLLGGLTLVDARLTKTAGGANDDKRVVGMPTTQSTFGAEWDVPGVAGLSVSSRVMYMSAQQVNAANTLSIPSWTRFDAGVRYVVGLGGQVITLRGRVDNIANKAYWANVGNTNSALVQGGPRVFITTASVDF
jgi:iron complex outermembrane receptor protein